MNISGTSGNTRLKHCSVFIQESPGAITTPTRAALELQQFSTLFS